MKTAQHTFIKAGALALGLGLVGTSGDARAEESSSLQHRFSVYAAAGAQVYLSNARTIGGIGGGIGVRDTLNDRFILQADLSYLSMLGNTASFRVGAGVQRSGTYAPAALLTLSTLFGERLSFLTPEHPTRISGPGMTLGVTLAPARFDLKSVQVSLLQLGIGAGTDLPGLGLSYSVGLLEVGATF
ncbi:hypothetical protein [Vitiosangium sp. GDMCC 1.1324]|uniref:hypothetical protein n=1 Tax=Vitiosangium sp. (strain GDMCC 1.1324) TaxID=2138576 RepID=UPI000D3331B6|nr:hypothetical protein [Vitiosangium sp. GDMCC 1.1324]PTL75148.1 hypothetical protein DAT35_56385 [Vitiosangium sp. GDMCC 1.1324]